MDANEYQDKIVDYSQTFPTFGRGNKEALTAYSIGLAEEVGEVAGLIKRHFRGDIYNPNRFQERLTEEMGDVIAYLAMIAYYFEIPLESVLEANVRKLTLRETRGTQLGEGER